MVLRPVFIDPSTVYVTVNLRILRKKIYEMTKDSSSVYIIYVSLKNKRFYVSLNRNKSRWKTKWNGFP